MKIRKNTKLLSLFVCMLFLTLAFFGTAGAKESFQWRLFASYPPTTLPLLDDFAEMVDEATDGRLKIEVYFPGEHPFNGSEMLDAVRDQRCQMAEVEGAYFAGSEPALAITGTPMVVGPDEQMYAMHNALHESGVITEVYERYNVKELSNTTWYGPSISSSKSLINDGESLKGQKIRVPTRQHAEVVRWLGGDPVTISWNEVYTSLQRGVIDGGMGALSAQRDSRWTEVAPYVTRLSEAIGMDMILVNKDAFNDLPEDLQKTLVEAATEYQNKERARRKEADALVTIQAIHEDGIVVRALPREMMEIIEKKAPNFTKEWAQEVDVLDAYEAIKGVLGW